MAKQDKPNIVMIMADDVGIWNISAYHRGMIGGDAILLPEPAKRVRREARPRPWPFESR